VEPGVVKPIPVTLSVNEIESVKPILQVIMPKPEFWDEYRKLPEPRKPIFRNPEDPAEIIANLLFHSNKRAKRLSVVDEIKQLFNLKNNNTFSFASGFIKPSEISEVCKHYNFPIVNEKIVVAKEIDSLEIDYYPVVLKGISKNVIHKSELNAVKLNIKNRSELQKAANEIASNFGQNGFTVEEYLIQQFILTKHEVLLGGYRDKSFGPIIMFGSGGKYVEILNDTAIRSAYISKEEILDMILSTSMGKILAGVRGESSINIEEMISLIQNASKMLIENEKIIEFDFNPIIVDVNNKLHAVDIRIKF
jgi:acyl-CoA synthetase (NDP forming)